jgi:hypothetical protein
MCWHKGIGLSPSQQKRLDNGKIGLIGANVLVSPIGVAELH